MDNMRLWSKTFHKADSTWLARNDAEVARAKRLLADYQVAEPSAGWVLETRGEQSDWHRFTD